MPNAFYNGAMWGQADAIWTFFVLVSAYLLCRGSYVSAILAFLLAVSVKVQAIFLSTIGPPSIAREKDVSASGGGRDR